MTGPVGGLAAARFRAPREYPGALGAREGVGRVGREVESSVPSSEIGSIEFIINAVPDQLLDQGRLAGQYQAAPGQVVYSGGAGASSAVLLRDA